MAPGLTVYDFVLLVLCTPVQFGSGYGFHKKAVLTLHTGTFLNRADVARMRHIWYPLPIRGGYVNSLNERSHCVPLSALTYALSPTPLHHTQP